MLFEKLQLEDDEKIVAIIRKHWWVIIREIILVLVLAGIPLCIPILFSLFTTFTTSTANAQNILFSTYTSEMVYLYFAWLLFLWMTLGNFWTDYYLDLWAITNKRVVLVDQRGFFHRFISSFRLERLQDMNIEISGIIPTLFDYGTIEAQTAGGSNEKFIGYNMPHPRDIKARIVNAADELEAIKPL